MSAQPNIVLKHLKNLKGGLGLSRLRHEYVGLVVQHGKNAKTCTVRVRFKTWFKRANCYKGSSSKFQVHD
jgi:ribosomal protein S17